MFCSVEITCKVSKYAGGVWKHCTVRRKVNSIANWALEGQLLLVSCIGAGHKATRSYVVVMVCGV